MPKPYSEDLRERVIEAVESGASRREAAENFRLSPSSAVRWWRRWHDTGSVKAKPSGGSKSPLEEHAEWLLTLIAEQPDLTLDEIVTAMGPIHGFAAFHPAPRIDWACHPREHRLRPRNRVSPQEAQSGPQPIRT